MRGPPLIILGVYAPHAGRPIEEREQFYKYLCERLDVIPECKEILGIGDWNVRFQARRGDETNVLGPHVYGRGIEFMEQCENRQTIASNRELLIDTMNTYEMQAINTWFQKEKKTKSDI